MSLNYDYAPSKAYCESIGLSWFGEEYQGLIDGDNTAKELGLTQNQVTALMFRHLWEVKTILDPKNYNFLSRLMISLYFLTGWKPK